MPALSGLQDKLWRWRSVLLVLSASKPLSVSTTWHWWLDEQGRYGEAEPLYRRALAINEKVLGAEHPDTATSLSNLASVLHDQVRYSEAEPLYRRALAIREKVPPPEHPDTAASLSNLAEALRDQGRYGEAESLYRRALAIVEKVLPPEHPATALILNSLAEVLRNQGRYGEAEPLFRRAVAIDQQAEKSDNLVIHSRNLSFFLVVRGRFQESIPYYRTAIDTLNGLRYRVLSTHGLLGGEFLEVQAAQQPPATLSADRPLPAKESFR